MIGNLLSNIAAGPLAQSIGAGSVAGLFKNLLQLISGLLGTGNQAGKQTLAPGRSSFGGGGGAQRNQSAGRALGRFLGGRQTGQANQLSGAGTATGKAIAAQALRTRDQKGYCFRAVARTLSKFGVNLSGRSAYMAADQLARNPKFREVRVSRNQLRSLPAGAVVVWNRGRGLPHGHIGIALGDGREASWKVRQQLMLNTSYRVFLPKG